jgi:hypothetical protein
MAVRGWVLAGLVLALPGFARAVGLCPSDADVVVYARNLSADPTVTLALDGELLEPTASCTGEGAPFYETTLTCAGSGLVSCGRLRGLRPGAWVNRVNLTVAGSPAQVQAQSAVFLASAGNVVVWTIYPRTFVVTEATETDFLEQIALAEDSPVKPALVTFARAAFPGAAAPQTITFTDRSRVCDPDNHNCSAVRLTGSQVVVDALDARAQPGAVVLSVGVLRHSLVRVLGSGNVLRGLVLQGTRNDTPLSQYDTVAISGPEASGTRIERSIVHGPTMGDAVGVDAGGLPGGAALEPTVIERCELSGARDKGIKANGTSVRVLQSCVHDNGNGGVQSTLGGRVVATDNVVQHNVPGAAQNGLSVGGEPGGPENRSTLVSSGNIVRFAGSRGLSVADNSDATFTNDFVSDAQFAGARVETKVVETVPTARFRGVALVCNANAGITGVCRPRIGFDDLVCATDADCCGPDLGCCRNDPGCTTPAVCAPTSAVDGFGAVVATDCPECSPPAQRGGGRSQRVHPEPERGRQRRHQPEAVAPGRPAGRARGRRVRQSMGALRTGGELRPARHPQLRHPGHRGARGPRSTGQPA